MGVSGGERYRPLIVTLDRILLDTYENFVRHLEDREHFGQQLGLDRIRKLLGRLKDPQKKFSSIHIAGTNGKGSTAAMLASILKEAGLHAGLFTSPHLVDFCERIRIGGGLISPEQVLSDARRIRAMEEEPLTFFEMATAIAFLHFAEEKVPVAVVETGLGGRLDATNVLTPLVSVITSIGFDHTQHLGKTLGEIAFEKGGIIKEGVPVVVGPLPPEAMEVVREIADRRGSKVIAVAHPLDSPLRPNLAGDHQCRNATVAVAVIEELRRQGYSLSEEAVSKGLANVRWPGRLETVSENPWILLDGAHNGEAMRAVRAFLEERLEGRRLGVVFGCMTDKDGRGLLSEIAPITSEFFLTPLHLKRGALAEDLRRMAVPAEIPFRVLPSVPEALETALQRMGPGGVILVTGSFCLVGKVYSLLNKP